ncbi:fungal-specific transcription factor domain-containing protein [Xylogone sp. PMI_703]|nr:fungal-specific transcription factor domain-containing protein [Xylogone sp. PMI_703]
MAIGGSPSNTRRYSDAVDHLSSEHNPVDGEPPTKRRRVFLQTMGQQLRGVGMSKDAPRDDPENTSQACAVDAVFASDRAPSRQVNQIQTPESDAVPGEDDHNSTGGSISASKQLWQPGEVAAPRSDPGVITFDDLFNWTQSYFDNWHLAYPFLHAPTVLKYFERVAQTGIPDPTQTPSNELIVLKSIMSIALADRRQTGTIMRPVPANLVFTSFNDSIHSVQQALSEESSIEALQAIVSVQLFLMSMLRYNAASRLQGLAARMAFQLGLHRCPMRYSSFPRSEAQLRKRLFWSMYCIDRYICIRLCVPQTIRDSDVDVCWPTSEQHGGNDAEKAEYDDRLDLLIFLSRHAEVRGLIMELRNRSDSQSQVETDEAVTINAELSKWWNDVETYLESSSMNSVPLSKYHEVTLVVLRHEAIIAINKHTIATARKPSTYNAALQNCIGASRAIISALYRVLEVSGRLNSSATHDDSEETALFWPSFTWAVWMSAFIMIYAANEDQAPVDVATR